MKYARFFQLRGTAIVPCSSNDYEHWLHNVPLLQRTLWTTGSVHTSFLGMSESFPGEPPKLFRTWDESGDYVVTSSYADAWEKHREWSQKGPVNKRGQMSFAFLGAR